MMLSRVLFVVVVFVAFDAQTLYQCDFEDICEDFVLDDHWIVNNVSLHIDHTYQNLSGHYATYVNTSSTESTMYTQQWVERPKNWTSCVNMWFYTGNTSSLYVSIELAQGDDHQARAPNGILGMSSLGFQWVGTTVEMFYIYEHYVPYFRFFNVTGPLDIDDFSVTLCESSKEIPPYVVLLDCDFDWLPCPDLVFLDDYSYSWSVVEAQVAHNETPEAPEIDYSSGTSIGDYLWLNNSHALQSGGIGYFRTQVFRWTVTDPMYCLSFQYYGFGQNLQNSTLTVWKLDEGRPTSLAHLWPIHPTNYTYASNRWSWAFVSLPAGNYSLLFGMSSSSEQSGSFALDSIQVRSCEYYSHYYLIGTSNLDFACDFDSTTTDSTCGIRDDPSDFPPDTLVTYSIRSPLNIDDQTLGPHKSSGWSGPSFLYWVRTQTTSPAQIYGQLKLSTVETNRGMCVRFAYFINSTNVQREENNTQVELFTRGCRNITLWSTQSDDTNGWQLVLLSLDEVACTDSFYIRITQRRPTPVVVALDDIQIVQCAALGVLTTTAEPPTTSPPNTGSSFHYNILMLFTKILFFICYKN